MIKGKNIILLLATATTGKTIEKSLECIQYYGGTVQGISALFSASTEVDHIEVDSIFHVDDLMGYQAYRPTECPFCKDGKPLDAIVNAFGYSKL